MSGRHVFLALRLLAFPTIAFVVFVGLAPGRAGLAIRIYALYLCAVAIGFAVLRLRSAYPAASPLRRPTKLARERRQAPETLAAIERETVVGVAGAFELHQRLRPRLRALAEGLLQTRRRLSLEREPEAARAILGETTWELVRPGRPAPADRLASGIPVQELRIVVESLENT
jgi:hypothetical protein